jgi:hypothetical protein
VERSVWTDQRLGDRFDHIDKELADLRTETRGDFAAVRADMRDGFGELRGEINDLRLILIRFQGAMLVALLGVIAAILVRGI